MKEYEGLVSIRIEDLNYFIFTLVLLCDVIAYPCVYLRRRKSAGIPHPTRDTDLKYRGKSRSLDLG